MDAQATPARPLARAELWSLVFILLMAAALRFSGITHHVVRGAPDFDEQNNFVRPIQKMWREGTLDPTVYQGYAGLFNWIAALPVLVGDRLYGVPGAYGAARGVVALFSLGNVLLAFLAARRLAGPAAGLFAAALLAVSRLDVRAAHLVTPDVLVATAALAVVLLMTRPSARADLASGLIVGLAAAVKYTGLYAGLPAAIAVVLQGGFWKRGTRIALAAALAFALAAPYAVVELSQRGRELSGLRHYYGERAERARDARGGAASGFEGSAGWLLQGVGPVGAGLALLGLVLGRDRRRLLPAAITVVAGLAAMSAAAYIFPRHVVPPAAVLSVLAGAGIAAVLARAGRAGPGLSVAFALASLPFQARASFKLTSHYLEPSAVDLAAVWLEAHVDHGATIAASLPRFAVDPDHFEVRRVEALEDVDAGVLRQFDLVVSGWTSELPALSDFAVLAQFRNEDRLPGRTLTILGPPAAERASLRRVAPVSLDASAAVAQAALATDGAVATAWHAPAGPGQLELRFAAPQRIYRVELEVGGEPAAWPQDLELRARASDAEPWAIVQLEPLRPSSDERQSRSAPRGQVFVVTAPRPVVALQVVRARGGPWSIAELRTFAQDEAPHRETRPAAEPRMRRRRN